MAPRNPSPIPSKFWILRLTRSFPSLHRSRENLSLFLLLLHPQRKNLFMPKSLLSKLIHMPRNPRSDHLLCSLHHQPKSCIFFRLIKLRSVHTRPAGKHTCLINTTGVHCRKISLDLRTTKMLLTPREDIKLPCRSVNYTFLGAPSRRPPAVPHDAPYADRCHMSRCTLLFVRINRNRPAQSQCDSSFPRTEIVHVISRSQLARSCHSR